MFNSHHVTHLNTTVRKQASHSHAKSLTMISSPSHSTFKRRLLSPRENCVISRMRGKLTQFQCTLQAKQLSPQGKRGFICLDQQTGYWCRVKGTDRNTNSHMVNRVKNALRRIMCVVINKTSVVHLRTNQGPIEKEQSLPDRSITCVGNALQNIQGPQTFVMQGFQVRLISETTIHQHTEKLTSSRTGINSP